MSRKSFFGHARSTKSLAAKLARKRRITPVPVSVKSTARPYRLEFEIKGLPPMANASGGSRQFYAIKGEREAWLTAVKRLTRLHLPISPLKRVLLTCTRFSSVEPDYDGLVHGFKAVIDALVGSRKKGLHERLVLADDKLSNTGNPDYRWERTAQGEGRIHVVVEEVLSTNQKENE